MFVNVTVPPAATRTSFGTKPVSVRETAAVAAAAGEGDKESAGERIGDGLSTTVVPGKAGLAAGEAAGNLPAGSNVGEGETARSGAVARQATSPTTTATTTIITPQIAAVFMPLGYMSVKK